MAQRLIWAPAAIQDVEDISAYVERDSPRYAKIVVDTIFKAAERVEMFPNIGRVVPEREDPAIREVLAYQYRIIYRLDDESVNIIAVVHGARDLQNALKDRNI
jgi:toxin ParE1/3/4